MCQLARLLISPQKQTVRTARLLWRTGSEFTDTLCDHMVMTSIHWTTNTMATWSKTVICVLWPVFNDYWVQAGIKNEYTFSIMCRDMFLSPGVKHICYVMMMMMIWMLKISWQCVHLPVNPRTHTDTRAGSLQRYRSYPFSWRQCCLCCPASQTVSSAQTRQRINDWISSWFLIT